MALALASLVWSTGIHLPPIGKQFPRVQQVCVTTATTTNACCHQKNGIVKLIRSSNLLSAPVIENRSYHFLEVPILPPTTPSPAFRVCHGTESNCEASGVVCLQPPRAYAALSIIHKPSRHGTSGRAPSSATGSRHVGH